MNSCILKCALQHRSLNYLSCLRQTTHKSDVIQSIIKSFYHPVSVLQIRRTYVSNHSKNNEKSLEFTLSKLQNDFTQLGYVSAYNFSKLLDSLKTGGSLPPEESIFLLESCGPELMPSLSPKNRMELFNKLWDFLNQNNALEKEHFVSFLKVHSCNGFAIDNFRKFLEDKQLFHYPMMYEKLLEHACQLGDMKLSMEILAEMKAKGYALTENVFNALIMGHARNKDLTSSLVVLETMKAAGVEPSSSTYTQLIGAYVINNNIEKATDIFLKHCGEFNQDQIIEVIKILSTTDQIQANHEFLRYLIKELPIDFLVSKEVPASIRNLCTELIHSGRLEQANAIMACLPCPKFNENQDIDTYGYIFLQDLFRNGVVPDKIIEIAKGLIESGKNLRALHIVCDSAMHRNPDNVYPYLKALSEVEPLRPHYFWPLLLHKFQSNGESGIFEVLKMMSELKVDCDFETLSFYVLPKLSVTLENPQQAIKTLESCGLKTTQLLSPLIVQLIGQLKLEDVIKIAQLYTSKLDTKRFVQPLALLAIRIRATKRYQKYANTIHTLHIKSNNPKSDFVGEILLEIICHKKLHNDFVAVERIISELNRLGAKISASAAEILNSHLLKNKTEDINVPNFRLMLASMTDRQLTLPVTVESTSSTNIVHPRDMSFEELENHLLELEMKKLNTRGVLRRLLQVCVRDNRLQRALEVKKKCEVARVELSPGMNASIFDMYIKLGDLRGAKSSLEHLQKTYPGFLLDEHKILDFAALLVKNNEIEEAKKLLTERAKTTKVFGGDYVIKNVWNLLTTVAQQAAERTDLPKEKNLTKEMYVLLKKLGFCHAHNVVLGPILREYILRKDIRSAVNEFRTLAEHFHHTPLQFELLSLLVRLSNQDQPEDYDISKDEAKELLQQVTRTVSSVHGQANMNSSLLLAVAESGTDNQLRKLLINPEFRLNSSMLARNCENLNKEGSVETLMRLGRACRGVEHAVKEHDVYNMLLKKFVDENNCAAALELFEKLEADDDLKISQEFLKNLVNVLKVNKKEIPSCLALRAQMS